MAHEETSLMLDQPYQDSGSFNTLPFHLFQEKRCFNAACEGNQSIFITCFCTSLQVRDSHVLTFLPGSLIYHIP